jgi:hypothetical protein
MYAAGYASTTTNRTQSAPTGSSAQTTLTVAERAALRTTSTHTLQASANATSTATWTLQLNDVTIGTIQITSGQSSGSTTLSQERRLEVGDVLKVIAPSGTPFPGGTTLTMTWVYSLAAWVQIPQEPNKLFVNNGSTWTSAKEAWVAEETTPNNYQWTRAWRVPEPPVGVTPDLEQTSFFGGDIKASWINTTTDFAILIEWTKNGSVFDTVSLAAGSVEALLLEADLANGDEVTARMAYFEGAVVGTYSGASNLVTYVG